MKKGRRGRLSDHAGRNASERRAGLETNAAEAPTASAGVLAAPCMEEGNGRNTGSPAGGAAHANRQPARARSGREGGGRPVVCARQRTGQEGSSPSGPRMRGAVSKGGGNASPAAGGRYGDTYTGTQAKAGHSQGGPGAPTTELRRTGRPSRGGVRRVCGAVPGRSRGGDPMTNQSAKGGARSNLHYGGEGALIHPPHQGVCGRHGTEDQCVTLGDLGGSAGGTAATDLISESEVGRDARRGVGRPSST